MSDALRLYTHHCYYDRDGRTWKVIAYSDGLYLAQCLSGPTSARAREGRVRLQQWYAADGRWAERQTCSIDLIEIAPDHARTPGKRAVA